MNELIHQFQSLRLSFKVIFLVVLLILGLLLGLHFGIDVPIEVLTNDIAVVGDLPVYAGILSQIGIFLWSATAAICLFTIVSIHNKEHKRFFLVSGLITIFLGLDDAFMFHEILFPWLGIHQKIVFLGYGFMMLFYLYRYYKLILNTEFILFALALGWFTVSMFIDNFIHGVSAYITKLGEDFSKFIGIVFWLMYFARTCRQFQAKNKLKAT